MERFYDLWVAVIMQAITDLKDVSEVERSKARTWLTSADSTFVDICDSLHTCPIKIRRGIFNEKTKRRTM